MTPTPAPDDAVAEIRDGRLEWHIPDPMYAVPAELRSGVHYLKIATPALAPADFDRTTAIILLSAAARSGDPGAIALAAQLAGAPPCPVCNYVRFACRCKATAAPKIPPPVAEHAESEIPTMAVPSTSTARVIAAFEALGTAIGVVENMRRRVDCEAAMLVLKEALLSGPAENNGSAPMELFSKPQDPGIAKTP